MKNIKALSATLAAVVFVAMTGCAGYELGAIKPTYMGDIETITIPTFRNDTLEPRLEVLATSTVIKLFQEDGTYRITGDDGADAILYGTIAEIRRTPARSVRGDTLATREFNLFVRVNYRVIRVDTGEVLDENQAVGRTSFFVSADLQQDQRQAIPLALEDLAVTLVSQVAEGW